jgi:hypothetical protein
MKIKHLQVAAISMATLLLTSSCIGSFSLFNHFAKWNRRATNSKFLNEIIGLLLSPIYGFCATADWLVLNSIEFWSGTNPLANNVGKTKNVLGEDGRYYAVTTLKNGYEIKTPEGKTVKFIHDAKTDTWSKMEDGKTTDILRFNEDGTVHAFLPNGGGIDVQPDAAGVYQVRMATGNGTYFAMK